MAMSRGVLARVRRAVFARHSNPWSAWSRWATTPVLLVPAWTRNGSHAAAVGVWFAVNPVIFPEPKGPPVWATKAILGEELWLTGHPRDMAVAVDAAATGSVLIGLLGAWHRRPMPAAAGTGGDAVVARILGAHGPPLRHTPSRKNLGIHVASVYKSAEAQSLIQDWCRNRIDTWDVEHRRGDVVTVAGVTSVVAAGMDRATAPTIVLVPGTNMNAAVSLRFAEKLARRWPTIILDVPGQPGLSADRRPRRNRLAWYGHWLTDVLEHAIPGSAVVVGHSLGGAIALACPSPRIAGRVLVSPAGLVRLAVTPAILAATIPWLARPTTARTNRLLGHMLAPEHGVDEELGNWMTLVARHCRSSLAPMPLPEATLAAAGRAAPCLVATGRHDVFLPPRRVGPAVRRSLKTELRSMAHCGHLSLDEQPDEIVALVAEVVTRYPGASTT